MVVTGVVRSQKEHSAATVTGVAVTSHTGVAATVKGVAATVKRSGSNRCSKETTV